MTRITTAGCVAVLVTLCGPLLAGAGGAAPVASAGPAARQLVPAEKGPGGQALYLWEVSQSWPGDTQHDPRLEKPIRFWRAALPLAEVFAGIKEQTGVRLDFWPEGDENPRVRANLFLNPKAPPTLRDVMAQLAWVTDCTFAYSEGGGEPRYYLLGASPGHGGPAAGVVEDRAQERSRGTRERALASERAEVGANLEELSRALSLSRADAIKQYHGKDEYLLYTLTDPALRGAAQYLCKATDPGDVRDLLRRGWTDLSEEERGLARAAAGFDEGWLSEAEVFVETTFGQPPDQSGAYLVIQVQAKTGPHEYAVLGVSGIVAPTRGRGLDELAQLTPKQIAAFRQKVGESIPAGEAEAYAQRWKAGITRARDLHTFRSLATEAGVSPAAQERLSALVVPLQSGRSYALWEVQEAVAAASGLNVVSDSFWQPARELPEAGSALLALASACHPQADRASMLSQAAWLAGWEWRDAGSFLRFRSIDREAWRAALLPESAVAELDKQLRAFLPGGEVGKWPGQGFTLQLSVEPADVLHFGSLLNDLQLTYGGGLLYEDPTLPAEACRHALREAFLSLALSHPVPPGRAEWEVNAFRVVASLSAGQWDLARGPGLRRQDLRKEQLALVRKAVPLWDDGYEKRMDRWVLRAESSQVGGLTAAHREWGGGGLEVSVVEPARAQDLLVDKGLVEDTTLFSWRCPSQCKVSVPVPITKTPPGASNARGADHRSP